MSADPLIKVGVGIVFLAGLAFIGLAVLLFVPALLLALVGAALWVACSVVEESRDTTIPK